MRVWFTATMCRAWLSWAVAAARQAMTAWICAGHLDRGDAGVAGKGRCGWETADAPRPGRQPAEDDRPDTVDLDQVAAGCGDGFGYLSGEDLQTLVCVANL
jgi:hypothetical protein